MTTDHTPKPSAKNWSRVADAYSAAVDESDDLNPVGAGCNAVLAAVDATLPFDQASYIVDMGTGPGGLISKILDVRGEQIPSDCRVVAADIARGLLEKLEERREERVASGSGLWERLEVREWDARELKEVVKDGEVSHLLSTYAYFSFRDDDVALAEAVRILAPGGLFVETSMGFTEWGHLATFLGEVKPGMKFPGPGPHWQSVEGVRTTLENAGFKDVGVKEFKMGLRFETHEEAVEFPFAAFPWVEAFVAEMSGEEVERARGKMLDFVKEKHPEAPFRLDGTGLVGWGRR